MSLRHALLGLLTEKPASGFDLTKAFDQQLDRWAWHTTHSHIYPELKRMNDDGLVEVVERASRGRKTYAITAAGRAEVRRWMLTPPTSQGVRNESVLRMFLIGTIEPTEATTLLRQYADNAEAMIQELTRTVDEADARWRDNPLSIGRLAAERGLRTLPAFRDWALWAIEQIERNAERPGDAGRPQHAHDAGSGSAG
ncbi:MAG: PadR family transcriptional regulator [Actinocatenispora sp.]